MITRYLLEINRISMHFLSNSVQPAHSIASFGLQSISFSTDVFAPHTDILCVTLPTTNFRDLMIRFPWSMNVKSMRDSGSESMFREEERIAMKLHV